jgi:sortase A
MKVVIGKTSLGLALKWVQRALFAGAIVMLGYCAFVLADIGVFQHRQKQHLERLLQDRRPAGIGPSQAVTATPVKSVPFIGPDGLIGRLDIDRLGLSAVIAEGTGKPALRHAAGHIAGTAMPGQRGNIGIAGHRDTFFRPLKNIQRDDIITLTTPGGGYRYRVVSTKVVNPSDVSVLNSDGNEILTLVTCYPFYFVGAAPSRFIVRAERVP